MPVDDPQDYTKKLQSAIDKILGSKRKEIPALEDEEDRELLMDWFENKKHEYSDGTLISYLTTLRIFAEYTDHPITSYQRNEFQKIINELSEERDWSKGTMRNYQKALKVILGYAGETEKKDHITVTPISDDEKSVDKDDILTSEQIRILLEDCARTDRDRAFIYLLYETGARLSAMLSLRIRNVKFGEGPGASTLIKFSEGAKALKGAKKHEVIVKPSEIFLQNYITREHPDPENSDAPFFTKSRENYMEGGDNSLSPVVVRRRLKRLVADCEEISADKVNPHNFRHSRVTHMRQEGYNDRQICDRMNWSRESRMLERYDHTDDDDRHIEMAKKMGLDVEETDRSPRLSACPRCSYAIDDWLNWESCPKCHAQLKLWKEPAWFTEYMELMEDEEDDPIHRKFLVNPHELYDHYDDVREELRRTIAQRVANKCAEKGFDYPDWLPTSETPAPDPQVDAIDDWIAHRDQEEASGD